MKSRNKFYIYVSILSLLVCMFGSSFNVHAEDNNSSDGEYHSIREDLVIQSDFINKDDLIIYDDIVHNYSDIDLSNFGMPVSQNSGGYTSNFSDCLDLEFVSFTTDDSRSTRWNSESGSFTSTYGDPITFDKSDNYVLLYDAMYDEYYVKAYSGGDPYIVNDYILFGDSDVHWMGYYVDRSDSSHGTVRDGYIGRVGSDSSTVVSGEGENSVFCMYDRVNSSRYELIATNIPIIAVKNDNILNDFGIDTTPSSFFGGTGSFTSAMIEGYNNFNGMHENGDTLIQIHPLKDNSGDGPSINSGAYMEDGKAEIFMNASTCNDGSVYIYFSPSDYQIKHASDLAIRFYCSSEYAVARNTNNIHPSYPSNYGIASDGRVSTFSNTMKYSYGEYLQIPMSDFVDNSIHEESLSSVNTQSYYSGGDNSIGELARFIAEENSRQKLWKLVDMGRANLESAVLGIVNIKVPLLQNMASDMSSNSLNVSALNYLFSFSVVNITEGVESDRLTPYPVNMLTGQQQSGYAVDPRMSKEEIEQKHKQENPDSDDDETDEHTTHEDDKNNVTVTSSGNGATATATANNNATNSASIDKDAVNINIENNSGGSSSVEPVQTTDSSLLPSLIAKLTGNNESNVDEYIDNTGVGGWFNVLTSVYTFIPTELWTILLAALATFLGITVVAFVIRIVLDLL